MFCLYFSLSCTTKYKSSNTKVQTYWSSGIRENTGCFLIHCPPLPRDYIAWLTKGIR
jgi:hypothetical protein